MDDILSQDDAVDLRSYALILWRRRVTILTVLVLVTSASYGLTFLQQPVYEAQAELAIEPLRRSEDTNLSDLILGTATIETERRVITSGPVTEGVLEALGLEPGSPLLGSVTADVVRGTRVVTIRVASPDPAAAAAIANTYVDEYLELRRSDALDRLATARNTLATRAQTLQEQLDNVATQLDDARDQDDESEIRALEAQRDSILTQLAQVSSQAIAADAEADLVRGGGTVLREARVPAAPASPRPLRAAVLGVVLGAMLGVGLAFLREFFNDGIPTEDVLTRVTNGAPVFGRIPVWQESHHRAVAMVAPHDHAVEAYRELRANVRFLMSRTKRDTEWEGRRRSRGAGQRDAVVGKSVLITSSIAGEGKSSTAANLAVVAAQGGARVALVDADMRRPQLDNIFGIGATAGLSDHLAEGGELERRLVSIGSANLRILPAGAQPPNPSELLASRSMADLLSQLEATHDLVVVDSPPVLAVADALEVAQLTSAVLLVASAEASSQRAIRRAMERLGHIGVLISGSVLNHVDSTGRDSYYGYYRPYARTSGSVGYMPHVPPSPQPSAGDGVSTAASTTPQAPAGATRAHASVAPGPDPSTVRRLAPSPPGTQAPATASPPGPAAPPAPTKSGEGRAHVAPPSPSASANDSVTSVPPPPAPNGDQTHDTPGHAPAAGRDDADEPDSIWPSDTRSP